MQGSCIIPEAVNTTFVWADCGVAGERTTKRREFLQRWCPAGVDQGHRRAAEDDPHQDLVGPSHGCGTPRPYCHTQGESGGGGGGREFVRVCEERRRMCIRSQVCHLELGKKQSDSVFYPSTQSTSTVISGQSWGRSKVTRCFIHPPSLPVQLYQGKVGEEAKWLGVLSIHPVYQYSYIRAKLGKKQSDSVFYPSTQSTSTVISGQSWGRSKVTRCFIHPPSQPVRLYQGKVGEEAKWLGVLSTHPVNQYGYIRAKLGKKQSDSVFYPPTQSTSTVISGQSWGRSKVTRCFIHPPSQPVRLYIRAKLGKKQSDSVFYPPTQSTSTVISGQSWGRSKVTRCFIHPPSQPVRLYIRAKLGKKGKCLITMLVRSGLQHDQKNYVRSGLLHYRKGPWGVVYCTAKGSLLGVVYCTTKKVCEELFAALPKDLC